MCWLSRVLNSCAHYMRADFTEKKRNVQSCLICERPDIFQKTLSQKVLFVYRVFNCCTYFLCLFKFSYFFPNSFAAYLKKQGKKLPWDFFIQLKLHQKWVESLNLFEEKNWVISEVESKVILFEISKIVLFDLTSLLM